MYVHSITQICSESTSILIECFLTFICWQAVLCPVRQLIACELEEKRNVMEIKFVEEKIRIHNTFK